MERSKADSARKAGKTRSESRNRRGKGRYVVGKGDMICTYDGLELQKVINNTAHAIRMQHVPEQIFQPCDTRFVLPCLSIYINVV